MDKLLFAVFLQTQGLQQVCGPSPGSAGQGCYRRLGLGMTHSYMTSGSNEAIQCKQFAGRERKREESQGERVECRNDRQAGPKYSSLFVI